MKQRYIIETGFVWNPFSIDIFAIDCKKFWMIFPGKGNNNTEVSV